MWANCRYNGPSYVQFLRGIRSGANRPDTLVITFQNYFTKRRTAPLHNHAELNHAQYNMAISCPHAPDSTFERVIGTGNHNEGNQR